MPNVKYECQLCGKQYSNHVDAELCEGLKPQLQSGNRITLCDDIGRTATLMVARVIVEQSPRGNHKFKYLIEPGYMEDIRKLYREQELLADNDEE